MIPIFLWVRDKRQGWCQAFLVGWIGLGTNCRIVCWSCAFFFNATPCDLSRCAQRRMGQCYFQRPKQLRNLIWWWASAQRYKDPNRLKGYKETKVRQIYGMEHLFAAHVWKIYIMECTMERRIERTIERRTSKSKNSTDGNLLWLAEIFSRDRLAVIHVISNWL